MAQTMFGDVFSARQTGMEDLEKSAATLAALQPGRGSVYAAGMAGGMLGRGLGQAFGAHTPAEAKQVKLQEVASQFPDLDPRDPEQLRKVQSALWQAGLYDQSALVGDKANEVEKLEIDRAKQAGGTAKHINSVAIARALVEEHGGDLQTAYNYVLTHPTGQTAFDLGVDYSRFLGGKDADVGVGEVVGEPDILEITEKPPTLAEIQKERLRISNLSVGAPAQDVGAYKSQLEVLGDLEASTQKTIDRLEKFAKENVSPISNELKNISDVRTFWNQAIQGNIAAVGRLKSAINKLGGDNRVGIQEVKTALGGGDIIERMKRILNTFIKGDLTEKDAEDIKRIIDALDSKYTEMKSDAIDRGRGAYSRIAADQYLDAYLPRVTGQVRVSPGVREAATKELERRGVIR